MGCVALIGAIAEQQARGVAAAHRSRLTGWPLTREVLLSRFIGFLIVTSKRSLSSRRRCRRSADGDPVAS